MYSYQTQNPIILVASEDIARTYPVAYGNTVVFQEGNHIYVKKMGYSQLEAPVFEKYVREAVNLPEIAPSNTEVDKVTLEELKSKIGALESEIKAIRNEMRDDDEQHD